MNWSISEILKQFKKPAEVYYQVSKTPGDNTDPSSFIKQYITVRAHVEIVTFRSETLDYVPDCVLSSGEHTTTTSVVFPN